MGLYPLEFSECSLDSPSFRERIRAHEAELDKTSRFIKELHREAKNLISATTQLGVAQRRFAECLGMFQFEYVGDAKTDDEKCIDESLQEFSSFLKNLEDQRDLMMQNITETLLNPLERFRKEQLGSAKEGKKKYEKETERYYSSLEKLLTVSAKKKDQHLQEADLQVLRQRFQEESLEYICKLQEIQERKKYECVEPMLAFFQTVFTFYHQGYELAKDFDHYKRQLQINIQNTRSRFEGTRSEVEELMKKFKGAPREHRQISPISVEGYLYVQEKRPPPFGSSWVKRYCTYIKEQKVLHMVTFEHRSGGKIGETDSVTLKSCSWKTADALDRRFCFDIEISDRPSQVLIVQALSEEDRKFWMQAMGGTEPVCYLKKFYSKERGIDAQLDQVGFTFVKNSISAVEKRGIKDLGLYRVEGVVSKSQKLLNMLINGKGDDELNLSTSDEWDLRTITSALKLYLRSLPEPLMTYSLYKDFINLAKSASPGSRAHAVLGLVHRLPQENQEMLGMLIRHLANVAANCKENQMTVANLGVVFGPTLMKPEEETVAAIMELKFQNIVVEILIEHHVKIFGCPPEVQSFGASTQQSSRRDDHGGPGAPSDPQEADVEAAASTNSTPDEMSSATRESSSPPPAEESGQPAGHVEGPPRPYSSMVMWINSEPLPPPAADQGDEHVERAARAVFSCEAGHASELSFQIGAIFHRVTDSKEPGWLEGELDGKRGLIPKNYVVML
ncbi:rho GTPase-activating protein 10-like isoform X1 [Paramormyrops kingsleyae]|uniref:rho GTPase-activating protein 10-like isoform X1 n=1 Tax=Paramormyrops kingsleyae TaxID=1676925 RepID=UPI003B97A8CB